MSGIQMAVSTAASSVRAIDDVLSGVQANSSELVLLFCSAKRNLIGIGKHIAHRWPMKHIVGCTSAGEITPAGYLEDSITAVSFSRRHFRAAAVRIDNLHDFALIQATGAVSSLRAQLAGKVGAIDAGRCFAVLLVDGTVGCEEKLAAALGTALAGIPMVGGSAADDWTGRAPFDALHAYVLHETRFRPHCAVLMLIQTDLPWRTLMHNHYSATSSKAVITTAEPDERLVLEINGKPAAPTYAELCGMAACPAAAADFSAHPAMICIGGQWFPRGILKLNRDHSMQFACAIERGLVVSVGESGNMVKRLDNALTALDKQIGPPALVLGFDCAARMVDMDQNGLRPQISALMQKHRVIGLSTLGEQYNTIHVNNSFTAVAIGTA